MSTDHARGRALIVVLGNQFVCRFYRSPFASRPFWTCGNTQMGLEIVAMLRKLGHRVHVNIQEIQIED